MPKVPEEILIKSKTGTQKFISKNEYKKDLKDQYTKIIFEKGDSLYNKLRKGVREKMELKTKKEKLRRRKEIEQKYKTILKQFPQ